MSASPTKVVGQTKGGLIQVQHCDWKPPREARRTDAAKSPGDAPARGSQPSAATIAKTEVNKALTEEDLDSINRKEAEHIKREMDAAVVLGDGAKTNLGNLSPAEEAGVRNLLAMAPKLQAVLAAPTAPTAKTDARDDYDDSFEEEFHRRTGASRGPQEAPAVRVDSVGAGDDAEDDGFEEQLHRASGRRP